MAMIRYRLKHLFADWSDIEKMYFMLIFVELSIMIIQVGIAYFYPNIINILLPIIPFSFLVYIILLLRKARYARKLKRWFGRSLNAVGV